MSVFFPHQDPSVDTTGSLRRQRLIQHFCVFGPGSGSARSAANATTNGLRAATSSVPAYAKGRPRAGVSFQSMQSLFHVPVGLLFPLLLGDLNNGSLVVAMVADMPLNELFNGERGETSTNNMSPEGKGRLKDSKEDEESAGLVRVSFTVIVPVLLQFITFSHLCFQE